MNVCDELKKLKAHHKSLVGRRKRLENNVVTKWKGMNVIATPKSTLYSSENNRNWKFNNIGYRMVKIWWVEFNDPIEVLRHRIYLIKCGIDQMSKDPPKKWYKFSNKKPTVEELVEDARLLETLEQKYMENTALINTTDELKDVLADIDKTSLRISKLSALIRCPDV